MSAAADIEVLPNAERLAETAAHQFVAAANTAIEAHGKFTVALSGGSTPRKVYARLATEPFVSNLDWSRVHFFWGDERCVAPNHQASNFRMARETLLDHVPVVEANKHRIHGEDDPAEAALSYERILRRVFRTPIGPPRSAPLARIDLVLLGLGNDGHTASLFPNGASLRASDQWVTAEYVHAVSMWRVTLTATVINAAAEVVFIASGSAKADIVRQVLQGPYRPHELPAQLIAPADGRLRWLLDASAAAELRRDAR
ncbi:MAG TPA: 6-phosphogluconolactonase [Gemmatimonadaceae bacterium]|nr:6-phosphogluconolactonase [Gemmatimonadaceae bacterium]